ncbi:cytochrome P450 [Lichenihabitans sp. PAMC28606]|uniref:cytochrome P450 n=1 Tax=Lichenihabitans sp. PAMC28606 TaxID=2880932 RepID=UPI001D09EBE2|nr:cytochrome P450 [Lichenihabitans sp. PAMC28606]UDL96478.1 cytochrome P450 [Lichenihabitans sp. PAMC28606]
MTFTSVQSDIALQTRQGRPAPRAPGPVPLDQPLGPLELLRALRDNPMTTWTKRHFTEKVVGGTGLLGRVMVFSDPALIRHVLVDNAANYWKGDLQQRMLSQGLGKGLLLAEGDLWRSQRRAMAPLFSPRNVAEFQVTMADVAHNLVDRWRRQRDGRTVDVANEMARGTLRILARTIFSDGLTRTTDEFATAVTSYLDVIGKLDPLDVLDAPEWVPRVGKWQSRPTLTFFEDAIDAMVVRRQAQITADPASAPRDLLTLLLEAADPETGAGLSELEVRANVMTFIAAGHETTSNALTWALYLLSQAPDARRRVEEEVDALLPDGIVAPGVLDQLLQTRAVLDEALRLYPPAATISREARDFDQIGDIRIKAGTGIIISPWVLHRHKLLWEQPDNFRPERFLPEARGTIDRFAYLPFGAGPRVCIGASFALQEAVTMLATIIRSFRLDLARGHEVMPIQRISLRPKGGMPMVLRRR